MTVLVTGAAGFIGAHVCRRLLARGEQVAGVDNINDYYDPGLKRARLLFAAGKESDRFRFLEEDFADAERLERALKDMPIDRIVHLGAQAGVRYSIDNPQAYIRSNLVGHANILELARSRATAHLVYASSSSVYGGNERLPFAVEDRVDRPKSLYAATKRADELLSESYAHLYKLPQTGLRFFTVYGPWGRPDMAVWQFTAAVLEGRPVRVFGDLRIQRDFTYIDDIVDGILAALDRPPQDDGGTKSGGSREPHAIYNLGNSRTESLGRLVALIEQSADKRAIVELLPPQPADVRQTHADVARSVTELGFTPSTGLETGIPRFVEWYRRHFDIA